MAHARLSCKNCGSRARYGEITPRQVHFPLCREDLNDTADMRSILHELFEKLGVVKICFIDRDVGNLPLKSAKSKMLPFARYINLIPRWTNVSLLDWNDYLRTVSRSWVLWKLVSLIWSLPKVFPVHCGAFYTTDLRVRQRGSAWPSGSPPPPLWV